MASKMPAMDWTYEPVLDAYKARMQLFLQDNDVNDTERQAIKIARRNETPAVIASNR